MTRTGSRTEVSLQAAALASAAPGTAATLARRRAGRRLEPDTSRLVFDMAQVTGDDTALELQTKVCEYFTITEKAPTWDFSWLKGLVSIDS